MAFSNVLRKKDVVSRSDDSLANLTIRFQFRPGPPTARRIASGGLAVGTFEVSDKMTDATAYMRRDLLNAQESCFEELLSSFHPQLLQISRGRRSCCVFEELAQV